MCCAVFKVVLMCTTPMLEVIGGQVLLQVHHLVAAVSQAGN